MISHVSAFGQAVAVVFLMVSAARAAAPESTPLHRAGPEEIGDLASGTADAASQDEGYGELSPRDDTWFGSTFWSGPDWTRVGKDWQHSGESTPSVRRWTAPRDGRVTITGRVYKADTNGGGGDGVRLSIRHGRRETWKAEIDGGDTKGVEPNLSLDVRRGDAVRFVVHKRGAIPFDTTHWDPAVAYADGERFQASEGFSTQKQDQSVWSYEMQHAGTADARAPRVHVFGLDFALQSRIVEPERPTTLTPQDTLPVVVIADGSDERGTVLALGPGPWRVHVVATADGRPQVRLDDGSTAAGSTPAPGDAPRLPEVAIGKYEGHWTRGMAGLQAFLHETPSDGDASDVRRHVAESLDRASARLDACPAVSCGAGVSPAQAAGTAAPQYRGVDLGQALSADAATERPALDYWAMIQDEWRREDHLAEVPETPEAYAKATADHLAKAARLLADLRSEGPKDPLAAEAGQLDRLAKQSQAASSLDDRRGVYLRARWLKRRIALANPKMQFGKLLFTKRVPTSYSHLVMQYYGFRARPGGGLFVLDEPGRSLACRDILDGRLAGGSVLEPRLSFDATRIVFSYVADAATKHDPANILNDRDEGFYHVYEVHVDGTGLRQLTSGPYDDVMPTYLPDGGIAFCSTRRRGYARCFGQGFSRRWQVYTLHRMDADGGNLRLLSAHDTNEWFPTVLPSGNLLYARWDYIDRDAVTHQNLWSTRPDGTNPIAVWGNATVKPHCSFQAKPIPDSNKIVFTASAHHSITAGPICIVDPSVSVDGQQAITRVTPEVPFPEAETQGANGYGELKEYYASPWPLSEKYFLVAYSSKPLVFEPQGANDPAALGVYSLDVFGNRELIYRDPAIGSTNPCPLVPRPTPPVVPSELPPERPPVGEMILADVYQGLGAAPRGSIRQLRIVQLFPKSTPWANTPPVGIASEENGRAILGTVPVEADGSARFLVPAMTPIYFQALDEAGFAYQTMRSLTYVQPGERVSCVGCHEARMSAPVRKPLVALGRPPSTIEPGPLDGVPFSFVRSVQPVLDKHCVSCHGGEKPDGGMDLTGTPHEGFSRAYRSLCGGDRDFWGGGTNPESAAKALVPRFGGRNQIQITPPGGMYGALGSRLIRLVRDGHQNVELSPDELRRLATWIDMNAIFYGVYDPEGQARQLRGEVVPMPELQ